MELFQNAIFVGGILPMIFFAFMDFSFRINSKNIKFQNVFFYTSLGGLISMVIISIGIFNIPLNTILELLTLKTIIVGIGLGLIWSIAISSMGIAYEKFNANASQVVPIASSSGLLTAFLGIILLQEKLDIVIFILSSTLIIIGIFLLAKAKLKQNSNNEMSIIGIILGGIIPLLGYGILNILFKIYSELNPNIIAIIMALTGIIFSLMVQSYRKETFTHNPMLIITGIFWALAIASLGYGFWPLKGEASTLLTIASASPLISILLVKIFLKENVDWKFIIVGALLIFLGISTLQYFG
jgi:uncharacterized membrane protein